MVLFGRNGRKDSLTFEGARVVDPTRGIDEALTVTVEEGVIALASSRASAPANGTGARARVRRPARPPAHARPRGRGGSRLRHATPRPPAATAPSSPCRTPSRSSTRQPCSARSSSRREREAEVPVGFLAAITKGQEGAELTEMVELAERGAAGFTDDGRPVVAPGSCGARSSTARVTGGRSRFTARSRRSRAAATCTRASSRPSSASAAIRRWPRASWSGATSRSPPTRSGRSTSCTSPRASRSTSSGAPARPGSRATAEVTPHHLCLTDEAVRSLDPNVKMNPPLRAEEDRAALLEALRDGTIEAIATDHAPHARHEKEVPFEEAPFGVTGLETAFAALYTQLVEPGVVPLATLLERMSAGPARIYGLERAADRGRRHREPRPPRPRRRLARRRGLASGRAPPTRGCSGRRSTAGRPDRRRRKAGRLARERLSRPRGRLGLPRPLGRRARRRLRRGGLHDRDDRLPGGRHRPELRRAARLLHGADGRQLRRLARSARSRRGRTRGRC